MSGRPSSPEPCCSSSLPTSSMYVTHSRNLAAPWTASTALTFSLHHISYSPGSSPPKSPVCSFLSGPATRPERVPVGSRLKSDILASLPPPDASSWNTDVILWGRGGSASQPFLAPRRQWSRSVLYIPLSNLPQMKVIHLLLCEEELVASRLAGNILSLVFRSGTCGGLWLLCIRD